MTEVNFKVMHHYPFYFLFFCEVFFPGMELSWFFQWRRGGKNEVKPPPCVHVSPDKELNPDQHTAHWDFDAPHWLKIVRYKTYSGRFMQQLLWFQHFLCAVCWSGLTMWILMQGYTKAKGGRHCPLRFLLPRIQCVVGRSLNLQSFIRPRYLLNSSSSSFSVLFSTS